MAQNEIKYTEAEIKSLDWREHIRMRPGMYIGKTGDGSSQDDGIYILVKEIIDNSIDEFVMGNGKRVDIEVKEDEVTVRDYGRGIPLGKVIDCVSKINTGGKYDSKAFKKSVGLNGVGTKAVNALSNYFRVESIRDKKKKIAEFEKGVITNNQNIQKTKEENGTFTQFKPDESIFKKYKFKPSFLEDQIWNYAYLNAGLSLYLNGKRFYSKNGLLDLLTNKTNEEDLRYPIIHLHGDDIDIALTHNNEYGEDYYSFVNGQYTIQGGTHLAAFREGIVKACREFYQKDYDAKDIRSSVVGAISVRVEEPVFESQTKTKLGSTHMAPEGATVRGYIVDFVSNAVNNYLHKDDETAKALLKRIQQSETERKELAGIKKLANQRAKKANIHNKKLRDCRLHFTDKKKERHLDTTIFITEGDSASGSITKARDVETQAVFSLRGKPLNVFSKTKKIVYENEEFNLLQHALNIENDIEDLRYNNVVVATDADVDGMHIRLLLMTFFLQFFPDLVRKGHVKILETPLFRVRNKKETIYCYSEKEKQEAMAKLGANPEITRFKGLGEISPDEFGDFIGENIRWQQVTVPKDITIKDVLSYYMGSNTPDRQIHIIENLRLEIDLVDDDKLDEKEVEEILEESLETTD